MVNASQIIVSSEVCEESRGTHSRMDFVNRMDELDYARRLESQVPIPMEQHWRKHTLSWTKADGETNKPTPT